MPLVNDDASAAARGRHVVSIDVGTRSSIYVADQRYSSPAGHPRAPRHRNHPPPTHFL